MSGGLGPTEDDLTREAIAAVLDETPSVDAELVANLRAFFASRGIAMPERNVKQAWTLPSVTIASQSLSEPLRAGGPSATAKSSSRCPACRMR